MSRPKVRATKLGDDLYQRLAEAYERATAQSDASLSSGFADLAPQEYAGLWQPFGELPEHIADAKVLENSARFCLFDGKAYIALRGGAFTEFERHKRTATIQPLTVIFNGSQACELDYTFDGRIGWTCFVLDIPAPLASSDIRSVEIERDGKLLFSKHVGEDAQLRNYRAVVWMVNGAGRLMGAAHADGDVPVEIHIGARAAWTITRAPAEAGRPRPFECDLAFACQDDALVAVSVLNPATRQEAVRSPLGVFRTQGEHFVLAEPAFSGDSLRAVLQSWQDGKRRRLALACAKGLKLEIVARVDLEDPAGRGFDGGDNSFVLSLDMLRAGGVMILDEKGAVLGRLPALDRILEFLAGASQQDAEPSVEALVEKAREAVAAKRWNDAVARWTVCIELFEDRPHWLSNRAHALLEAGRLDEAEREYLLLAERFTDFSPGVVGLARLAAKRGDWSGAMALWTVCLERFADEAKPRWSMAKAEALRRLGKLAEAEALLREAAMGSGDIAFMIRTAIEHAHQTGRALDHRDVLSEEIEHHFPESSGLAGLIEGMRLFSRLGDHEKARRRLLLAVPLASKAQDIEILFRAISELVEAGSRGPLWEQLLTAARADFVELELRLLLALERFPQFEERFDDLREDPRAETKLEPFERVRARLGKSRSDVFAEPKIFGIGLSRTGTQSLTDALRLLGVDTAHWINPLTFQLIGATDIYLFGACTDISIAQEFEKLYYLYPNARFVWTHRPLASWQASIARHYEYWHRASGIESLRHELERRTVPFGLARAAIEFGLYLNSGDFAAAHGNFEQRVRGFFHDKPPGKLLELDVFSGQGWGELCTFLGKPVPDKPFPHANKGK